MILKKYAFSLLLGNKTDVAILTKLVSPIQLTKNMHIQLGLF